MKTLKIGLLSTVLMLATGSFGQTIEKPVKNFKNKDVKIQEMSKLKTAPSKSKTGSQGKAVTNKQVSKKKFPAMQKMEPAKATK